MPKRPAPAKRPASSKRRRAVPVEANRIRRMLRLLFLVQTEPGWNPQRLARELDVSKRNVMRDLHDLKAAGIDLQFDRHRGGYHVSTAPLLPPVQLTPEEVLALQVLGEHLARRGQIAYLLPAWRALVKLTAHLPESLRAEAAALAPAMAIRTARATPPDDAEDVFVRVQRALAGRKALLCRYEAREGADAGEFLFEPYALFFAVRAWYVVGLHHGRAALRCLKLARFSRVALAGRAARVPPDFSLDDYLGNAWQLIRGERDHRVELLFDAKFAAGIAETIWHRTQETEERDDGTLLMRCTVSGLEEIVWWILSMGPHCRVLNPPELADRVRTLAEQAAALYRPAASASRAGGSAATRPESVAGDDQSSGA